MKVGSRSRHIRVCDADQLQEGDYLHVAVLYSGYPASVLLFKYKGKFRAYRNRCVHMPRELDCEGDTIFDKTGNFLRCSMHGIIYDPLTGESLSTMCNGERLTAIKITEEHSNIWIVDKKITGIIHE